MTLDINSELDELDREEFYRLKKVCLCKLVIIALYFADHRQVRNKKLKDAAAAEEIQKASRAEQDKERWDGKRSAGKADILSDEDDKDVIF